MRWMALVSTLVVTFGLGEHSKVPAPSPNGQDPKTGVAKKAENTTRQQAPAGPKAELVTIRGELISGGVGGVIMKSEGVYYYLDTERRFTTYQSTTKLPSGGTQTAKVQVAEGENVYMTRYRIGETCFVEGTLRGTIAISKILDILLANAQFEGGSPELAAVVREGKPVKYIAVTRIEDNKEHLKRVEIEQRKAAPPVDVSQIRIGMDVRRVRDILGNEDSSAPAYQTGKGLPMTSYYHRNVILSGQRFDDITIVIYTGKETADYGQVALIYIVRQDGEVVYEEKK